MGVWEYENDEVAYGTRVYVGTYNYVALSGLVYFVV